MAEPSEKPGSILPPLLETFPADSFPLREIGTGFTAQSIPQSEEAKACAATASEMLDESRMIMISTGSSDAGGGLSNLEAEPFAVANLPPPENAEKGGLLILRNERLFPGMVGISLPLQGILWVREDGTFNCSGFFRRQIPKFETAALIASTADMKEFLDVYHALYRPVAEAAASLQHFKVLRTLLEAGLQYYKDESPTRKELTELRRRVMLLRAQAKDAPMAQDATAANTIENRSSAINNAAPNGTERSSRSGSGNIDDTMSFRRAPSMSGEMSDGLEGMDGSKGSRSGRDGSRAVSDSSDRSAKIAQQVVTGAPKQKGPFRLWKSDTGTESYSKDRPS